MNAQDLGTANAWIAKNARGLPAGVVRDAAKEGSLMIYCQTSECPQSLIDSFIAVFPFIKVDVYRAPGGALAERFRSEISAKREVADIVMNSSPAVGDSLAADGSLLQWTPPTASQVPAQWAHAGYWYGIGLLHAGIGWNTEKVTPQEEAMLEKITSWKQIANPVFKGRTVMGDIREGGFFQMTYSFLRDSYGEKFWVQMRENLQPVILEGSNPAAQRLAAGEYAYSPVAISDIGQMVAQFLKGAPVRWTYPEPGLAVPHFISISKIAPHTNAAKLFTTWALSKDGQSIYVNEVGLAPMRSDIVDNRAITKTGWYKLPKTYFKPDWAKISREQDATTAAFIKIFEK
jgi:iron(III) transport system substrate-binding protein